MKRILYIILTAVVCGLQSWADNVPAFPGAEGFGMYTTGGRGGTVYHVKTLDDTSRSGTFRYACERSGARTIVFDVSGTIHLTRALQINGDVTIAGQTAPGDGICVADYPVTVNGDNVIIRYMRFRLGNKYVANHEGDGLGAMDHNNIIIDHCSVSWSIDECLSVYGGSNITVQWCIASQSLKNAGHSKGAHGYGGNWGGSGASYHHNLIAHNESRTPRLGPRPGTQTDERMDMRNNVIYNWGGEGCYGGEGMNVNIVNNYYKPGPCTLQSSTAVQQRIAKIGIRTTEYTKHGTADANQWDVMWHQWGTFYVDGNYNSGHSEVNADNWTYGIYNQIANNASVDYTYTDNVKEQMRLALPVSYYLVTTHSAKTAYERVLSYAGASLNRDALDALMVADTRNGTATATGSGNRAGIINTQDDVAACITGADSPWPALASGSALTDSDGDGIPDSWETAHGLNAGSATDGRTVTTSGYTNLELYINSLVDDITHAQNADGTLLSGQEEYVNTDPAEYVLSPSTHTTDWNFTGGYSISVSGKNYATGSSCGLSGIKYSAGTQYTICIPSGIAVTKVEFTAASNYDSNTSTPYLREVNGVVYDSDQFTIPVKETGNTPVTHAFSFDTPLTGTLTFTPAGAQIVCVITLYGQPSPTGIVAVPVSDSRQSAAVYDMQGRRLADDVSAFLQASPPKGVYIIKGRKIVF